MSFLDPVYISDEMAHFVGTFPRVEMHHRPEVTRQICDYVKAHALWDCNDRRTITCDSTLAKLMQHEEGYKFTYFSLQYEISHHFAKRGRMVGINYAMRRDFLAALKADLLRHVMHPRNVHRLADLRLI
jgi:hypothetical protein